MVIHMMHNFASAILLLTQGWLLTGNFDVAYAVESDISCLKSLKDSLQDPYNKLSSWDFSSDSVGFICSFVGISCWNAAENKVLGIELSDMGLKGNFPRGLENCTSLTTLDLSGNQLSGSIPFDIGQKLKYLTTLHLSNNYFSGLIPSSIANCSYLGVLILDNNRLIGPIPSGIGLMSRIRRFSVINNSLAGPVPIYWHAQISPESYGNNQGLCGHPLEPCDQDVVIPDENNNRALLISGFLTGWAISTTFTVFVCLFVIQRLKRMISGKKKKRKRPNVDGRSLESKTKAIQHNQKMAKIEKYVTRISLAELANATANFSHENIIGIGKMGTMYKATLPSGWPLAIMRLFSSDLEKEIVSELMTLGRLRHHRLVPLVGFCSVSNEIFLIYKFMANGNLYDWLHFENDRKIMAWPLRIKIAVGIAEGLAWFHHKYDFKASHSSINSKCILLDGNFEPRISNFWEAKLLMSTDSITSWSPFRQSGSLDLVFDKKDVYYFGILLLELVTLKEPPELDRFVENWGDTDTFVFGDSSALLSEINGNLVGHGFDDEILQFLEIANNCVRPCPDQRPSMLQVYQKLEVFSKMHNYTCQCV